MRINWIKGVPILLLLFACAQPQPYIASRAFLEKLQPGREIIPARKGCDVCHKIFADRFVYKYYPIRISHKAHAGLGIECVFCHRGASSSTKVNDYLIHEGHGFANKPFEKISQDKNPCKICHIYSSASEKEDGRMPGTCKTCHPSYSEGKPLPYRWWRLNTNLVSNHKTHYDRGIPCLRCHPGFDLMEETTLGFTPKMDICNECHGAERIEEKRKEAEPAETAKLLYLRNCAMCHGRDGKGDGQVAAFLKKGLRPRDLTDSAFMTNRTDEQLRDVISKGGPALSLSERMPSWEGLLNEDEVAELVRYIRRISGGR